MKIIPGIMVFGLLVLLAFNAMADERYNTTIINNNSQAMGLAVSEINPTLLSSKWQMGVGFGSHNNGTAIALGLAKRINKNLLFSGKVANQDGDIGTSMGLNFKF